MRYHYPEYDGEPLRFAGSFSGRYGRDYGRRPSRGRDVRPFEGRPTGYGGAFRTGPGGMHRPQSGRGWVGGYDHGFRGAGHPGYDRPFRGSGRYGRDFAGERGYGREFRGAIRGPVREMYTRDPDYGRQSGGPTEYSGRAGLQQPTDLRGFPGGLYDRWPGSRGYSPRYDREYFDR